MLWSNYAIKRKNQTHHHIIYKTLTYEIISFHEIHLKNQALLFWHFYQIHHLIHHYHPIKLEASFKKNIIGLEKLVCPSPRIDNFQVVSPSIYTCFQEG